MKDLKVFLEWKDSFFDYLPKVLFAIIVFLIFYFIGKLFRKLSFKFYSKSLKRDHGIVKIISSVVYFFFLLSGVFLALEILGLDGVLTKFLASAGIVGIIAGFAFKDIVSNIFAGFLLRIEAPFKKNDWVEIAGNFGNIRTIGWVTTSIKTIEGQEVFVPNQMIYNTIFTNYSVFGKRRVVFKSGVAYGDDLDLVKKVTLEEVKKIDAVLINEDVDFYFTGIGSSAYNFEVRFWIRFKQQKDYLKAMNEIVVRIQKRFAKENISIAYSVMTLDFGVKGGVNLFDKTIDVASKKKGLF